ncbi:MAG: DNA primase [Rhodospirillales bacterium]
MSFPEALLEDIRARISLVDLIGRHVRLTRQGREHRGLCPFHKEKTPSFRVYDDHYHCYGCGAHGSAFDFAMQIDRLAFPQAVERLAELAGVTLPQPEPQDRQQQQRRHALFDAMAQAASYFEQTLRSADGKPAREYLAGRGLDDGSIRRFRLGYALPARTALKTALARANIAEAVMIEAGLLVKPDDQNAPSYDRFRNRVIFPIADRRGRIVGFGGRVLAKEEPKYLNSPETPLFHKGRLLYGMPAAAEAAQRTGRLIVVEGYMDAIGLALAGYEETVAPLGTAMTPEQIQELWRLAPTPILCFDPDAAGRRAAMRACERALPLLRPGLGLRFAFLGTETGDDPDAVARRYPPQFLARTFAEAVPLSTMLVWLETGGRTPSSPEDRAATIARLKDRAGTISDPSVRAQFLASFQDAVPRVKTSQPKSGNRRRHREPPPVARVGTAAVAATGLPVAARDAEVTLLAILCRHPDFFHEIEEEIGVFVFADPERDRLRQALIALLSGQDSITTGQLQAALPDDALRAAVEAVLADPIVRIHRLIAATASPQQVRATWRQSANHLRRLLDNADPLAAKTNDVSDAVLSRRFARKGALLDEQATEQNGDVD